MPKMSKADIHIHTNYSDGLNDPEAVVNYVVTQTDLRVIAITDHNTIAGAEVAYDYWRRHRDDFAHLEVIKGVEVSSATGHILGLFLEEDIPMHMSAADTVQAIHEQGGLAIAAHPFTHLLPFTDFEGIGRQIGTLPLDGVEARSSVPTELYANWLTSAYNRRHLQHAALGSSDAHYLTMIGKTHTLFPGETAADFRRAVTAKQVAPGGRIIGPGPVVDVMAHLIRRRQLPLFLPNDHQFRQVAPELELTISEVRGHPVGILHCSGQLVSANAGLVKREITRLLLGGLPKIIVDMRDVRFIDSAGIGALVAAQKRVHEHDGALVLSTLQKDVALTIRLLRLDKIFPIVETLDEAMTAVTLPPSHKQSPGIRIAGSH
jgi:anti-anti-sigma factor